MWGVGAQVKRVGTQLPSSHKLPLNLTPICKNSSYVCVCVCVRETQYSTEQYRTTVLTITPLVFQTITIALMLSTEGWGRLCR